MATLTALLSIATARADEALDRVVNGRNFQQFVADSLRAYAVPGAVVAISTAERTMFLKGYGLRGPAPAGPVDGDTRFQIASLSKFVAATAVATLVDRQILSWDAPVRSFSPATRLAVDYASDNATLRDYFAHRTGLPAYAGDLLVKLGYDSNEIVARARYLPLAHSFRSRWAYSNLGIFLGQQAASQAVGITPPRLIAQAILQPLGMARSGPDLATLLQDENRAIPADLDGTAMAYDNVDAFSGAGAIVSTGADIARWMRMLLARGLFEGRRILNPEAVDEIFAASMVQPPGGPLNDPNDAAGLGCESYHFLRYRIIEKNGALNGMRSIVTLIPERGLGIAVFANKQLTVFPEAIRAEFLERELGRSGRDLQKELRAQQPAWHALVAIPTRPSAAPPPPHPLDVYAGRYTSALYGVFDVKAHDGQLQVAIGPHAYAANLTPWSGNTFLLRFPEPDVAPGLLTFRFAAGQPTPTALEGSDATGPSTMNYGTLLRAE